MDVWSIGCIFAEMCTGRPLFPGTSEKNQVHVLSKYVTPNLTNAIYRSRHQIQKIFRMLGTPTKLIYPGLEDLPLYKVGAPFFI